MGKHEIKGATSMKVTLKLLATTEEILTWTYILEGLDDCRNVFIERSQEEEKRTKSEALKKSKHKE